MKILTSLCVVSLLLGGCASSPARVNRPASAAPAAPTASVQALFESGRDDEVVNRVASTGARPEEIWFGAQSLLRMGQRDEAVQEFQRLRNAAGSDAFQRAADVAIARLGGGADALAVAQAAAAAFPADPYVQFEAGITLALRGDNAAAAQAFDAAINASPTFAYAYYQAGLAYSRIERLDMTVARFEAFERLAPSAPERPQVDSILRTARGR
jgi:tetratricopeptide (TPR) repeat protein